MVRLDPALVAWIEIGCRGGAYDMRWRLVAVSRRAGHRFGLPRIIHSGGAWDGLELDIALDARGGGTIAWARRPQEAFRDTGILVSTRRPGRRFTRPRLVDAHAATPQLAAGAGALRSARQAGHSRGRNRP